LLGVLDAAWGDAELAGVTGAPVRSPEEEAKGKAGEDDFSVLPEQAEKEVRYTAAQAAVLMRGWGYSVTWRTSALAPGASWASLPLPVWDLILREDLSLFDLRRIGMVCRQWHEAVTRKIPSSRAIVAENATSRRAAREQRRRQERHGAGQTCCWVGMFVAGPIVVTLAFATVGFAWSVPLVSSVSIVPDCAAAQAMAASLYCCCAFWLADAAAFLALWSVSNCPSLRFSSVRSAPSIDTALRLWNAIRLAFEVGVWSSAAACIHFCGTCSALNPLVALQIRAFAATSLVFGLVACALTSWVQVLWRRR
jgi:hypothetical protein